MQEHNSKYAGMTRSLQILPATCRVTLPSSISPSLPTILPAPGPEWHSCRDREKQRFHRALRNPVLPSLADLALRRPSSTSRRSREHARLETCFARPQPPPALARVRALYVPTSYAQQRQ